jgi:hypothetical protein
MIFYPLKKEIRDFVKRIILFFLPVIFIVIITEIVGIYSGELLPLKTVARLQSKSSQEITYGRGFLSQEQSRYKFERLLLEKPDVLVIGSSRVMQFGKEMFSKDIGFYNAGGVIQKAKDLRILADNMPQDYSPKIIILGIDYFWFDDKYSPQNSLDELLNKREEVFELAPHLFFARKLMESLFFGEESIIGIIKKKDTYSGAVALGTHGYLGEGFQNDGSIQRAVWVKEMKNNHLYVDRETPTIYERVSVGMEQFKHGSQTSEELLSHLKYFLEKTKERNIKVIGFAPPFFYRSL